MFTNGRAGGIKRVVAHRNLKAGCVLKRNGIIPACIVAGALAAALVAAGCGKDPARTAARDFDRIAAEALELYRVAHPLRWSRLGLAGADSLLFTFSTREIESTRAAIDTLVASMSALHAAHLDARRLDDSALLLGWMGGLRFALGPSGEYTRNPLLYCWLIEEALFGLPARPFEPSDTTEAADYARRLSRLPALIETASQRLDRPGIPYLEAALLRLEDLERRLPALRRLAERRYERPIAELAAAHEAIAGFRERLAALRLAQPRERMIMGLEDLALVLKYAEHINLDLSELIAEAETVLRRQTRRREGSAVAQPAGARAEVQAPAAADSLLAEIEAALETRRFLAGRRPPPSVTSLDPLYRPLRIPVNPYLTVPATPLRPVYSVFGSDGRSGCAPAVVVTPRAATDEESLFYDLLLASAPLSAPARDACRQRPPLRLILGSETFHFGWQALMLQELPPLWPERKAALALIENRERSLALAIMVITLRLHAGAFTMETASGFLRELDVVPPEQIPGEVLRASASPAAAFEGISALLLDRMIKRAAKTTGEGNPRGAVKELLQEGGLAPLGLLMRRLPA